MLIFSRSFVRKDFINGMSFQLSGILHEMPLNTQRANGKKSKIRACVEHVFAVQKERMGLFIQTIGLDRARIKITFANLAYNLQRLVFWEKRDTITQ